MHMLQLLQLLHTESLMGSTAPLVLFLLWSLVDVHPQTIPYMDIDTRICTHYYSSPEAFESYDCRVTLIKRVP